MGFNFIYTSNAPGIPVTTVGLDAHRTAEFCAQILGTDNDEIHDKIVEYKEKLKKQNC